MDLSIMATPATKKMIESIGNSKEIMEKAKKEALTTAAMIFQAKAKQEAPTATTNLRKNIKYEVERNGSQAKVFVDDSIEYAKYQEEGTKAHGPKRAKMLAWQKGGQWIFARWVRGITGKHFMRTGMEETERQQIKIDQVLFNAMKRGLGL
jgi:HK97 gp10 family phage protein